MCLWILRDMIQLYAIKYGKFDNFLYEVDFSLILILLIIENILKDLQAWFDTNGRMSLSWKHRQILITQKRAYGIILLFLCLCLLLSWKSNMCTMFFWWCLFLFATELCIVPNNPTFQITLPSLGSEKLKMKKADYFLCLK